MHRPFQNGRVVFISLSIVIVSVLHYATATTMGYFHEIYKVLYYIPIIVAAFWYGIRGGLMASLAVSMIYLPHVMFQWRGDLSHNISRFLEIILYNVIALVTGILAEREQRERRKYEETARELADSYEKLKLQSEKLTDIEEQLRFADRLAVLGELSANLAHEVRNPLVSIQGVAEILQEEYPRTGKNREFVEILAKEVKRLNHVVENFLSLVRSTPVQLEWCALGEVIQSVVSLVSPKARKEGVTIRVDVTPPSLQVRADPNQLRQVFLNLLLNALASLDGKGTISLTAQPSESGLAITVQDTGKGIPPEHLARIFEPFFTTKPGGTGLGLPITKRILDAYGWTMRIDSTVGQGTTVTITIPVDEPSGTNRHVTGS